MESESQDIHFLPERMDYHAQLFAIRSLLIREERAAQKREHRIAEVDELARRGSGAANYHGVEEWVDLVHSSCYQGAAHSTAAVGLLAPLHRVGLQASFSGRLPENRQQTGKSQASLGRNGRHTRG